MSLRGFGGIQSVFASAVPAYGTSLQTAVSPTPDPFTGRLDPGSQPSSAVLSIYAPSLFRTGDHVLIGPTSSFEQGNTTPPDGGVVQQVNQSASNILVTGLQRKHSASEWVVLAQPVSSFNISCISASNALYIGEDPTVSDTSTTLLAILAGGGYQYGESNIQNVLETQHLWVYGGGRGKIPTDVPYDLGRPGTEDRNGRT